MSRPIRIAIVGTSGSGKTTLARRLSMALGAPAVELDALNWGPDWRNRSRSASGEFIERVEDAVAGDRWVVDGNYRLVQPIILAHATDVIWLDYSRWVIMRRVLVRSIERAASGAELWPGTGNRESWRRWLGQEHPIRWAWDTHAANRARYAALFAGAEHAHLRVHRLRRPVEVERLLVSTLRSAGVSAASLRTDPGEARG